MAKFSSSVPYFLHKNCSLWTQQHPSNSFRRSCNHGNMSSPHLNSKSVTLNNSLNSCPQKKLPKDLLAQVEHFQNSFICQKEVIDKLRHDLPDSRHKVEHIFKNIHFVKKEEPGSDIHHILRERMDTFRKLYDEVREDFNRFESDWT